MHRNIKEFVIKTKEPRYEAGGEIYKKLGLDVYYSDEGIHIRSTETTHIKTVGKEIHLHVYDMRILKKIIADGYVNEIDQHNIPLHINDEFGNLILASFMPKEKVRNIAIITSGGDAPGMNPAIRAAVRTGIKWDANVYGIYYGYEGMISDDIRLLEWSKTNSIIDVGGTILFSARSKRFKEKQFRKEAVYNLAKRKIVGLLILGGDGSIHGGTILKDEFTEHVNELIKEGKLPEDTPKTINLAAIPASIDNDIPYSDISLGADTALHRVVEAVDSVITTMISHDRIFVMEVMGRDCGWIALMSAFATGADYVFIPESPTNNWREEMVNSIKEARSKGKKGIFVIVSEGAIDESRNKIGSQEVVDHLLEKTDIDVRLLKLGHLQRGGAPSAFDRISGTLLAIKATEYLLSGPEKEAVLVSLQSAVYTYTPLKDFFEAKAKISEYQEKGDFKKILEERDAYFKRSFSLHEQLRDKKLNSKVDKKIGILHCGGRAGGMNTTLNAVVRYAKSLGTDVLVFQDGFDGLLAEQFTIPNEYDYVSHIASGGSVIGTGLPSPKNTDDILNALLKMKIDSLILIGGSSGLLTIEALSKKIKERNLQIDLVLIPSTTSNNVPGTELSLGCDTALNCITNACEVLRLSSMSVKNHVFILEVHGGHCGFLSLMGGIAAGAFDAFIPERRYLISHLSETAKRLRYKYKEGARTPLLLIRNEKTFTSLSTDAFAHLLKCDSENLFDIKYSVLGYLQQGANPSPMDRINSTVLGIKTLDLILKTDKENISDRDCFIGVIGIQGRKIIFTEIEDAMKNFDREMFRDKNPFWLQYASTCRSLE